MSERLAKALFEPAAVALIGASTDLSKPNGRPLQYLQKHGFAGRIFPINPRAEQIGGLACFPDLKSLPERPDHAFIMLSGEAALAAVRDCAEAGVTCATILAGGFAEAGAQGLDRQQRLLATARAAGVRLLGPNSIGVINVPIGLALSANAMLELPDLRPGRTAVVSQSGSMIGAILSHGAARNVGFSKLVSVGNEADLTAGEVGDLLVADPATDVILLFLETIRHHEQVAAFARRAHAAGKPVVAYRVGRSAIGRELAQSHTGALAGDREVISAFLAHHGIAEVGMFESLIEAPRIFGGRKAGAHRKSGGVAIVTTTGGGGAMVVDNLGLRKIEVARVPTTVIERLAAHGVSHGAGRMVDLTMAGAKPEVVHGVIGDLMADPSVMAVVMVVGSSARFHPDLAVNPLLAWTHSAKPFAAYLAPEAEVSRQRLATAGIPVFRTPEACADALQALLRWPLPAPPVAVPPGGIRPIASLLAGRKQLNESQALEVFAALGLRTATGKVARSGDEAAAIADDLGYPVAVKVASPDIAHKSDAGGVRLNIVDAPMVRGAYAAILAAIAAAHPNARVDGVLIQAMQGGLAEVLIGYKRDPSVGPLVMVGRGGLLAELYADTSVRMAPVSVDEALAMIDEVVGLAPLRGYRNMARGDLLALANAVTALSMLAFETSVAEAEINPLIVGAEGRGAVAVDGLVVCNPVETPQPGTSGGYGYRGAIGERSDERIG